MKKIYRIKYETKYGTINDIYCSVMGKSKNLLIACINGGIEIPIKLEKIIYYKFIEKIDNEKTL